MFQYCWGKTQEMIKTKQKKSELFLLLVTSLCYNVRAGDVTPSGVVLTCASCKLKWITWLRSPNVFQNGGAFGFFFNAFVLTSINVQSALKFWTAGTHVDPHKRKMMNFTSRGPSQPLMATQMSK